MFCPKCGYAMPEEAKFCGHCGEKIKHSVEDVKKLVLEETPAEETELTVCGAAENCPEKADNEVQPVCPQKTSGCCYGGILPDGEEGKKTIGNPYLWALLSGFELFCPASLIGGLFGLILTFMAIKSRRKGNMDEAVERMQAGVIAAVIGFAMLVMDYFVK